MIHIRSCLCSGHEISIVETRVHLGNPIHPSAPSFLPIEAVTNAPITFQGPSFGSAGAATPLAWATNDPYVVALIGIFFPFQLRLFTDLGAKNSIVVVTFRSPFWGAMSLYHLRHDHISHQQQSRLQHTSFPH